MTRPTDEQLARLELEVAKWNRISDGALPIVVASVAELRERRAMDAVKDRRTMDGPTDALVKAVREFFARRALNPPPRPGQVRESIDLIYLQLVHFDECKASLEREPASAGAERLATPLEG